VLTPALFLQVADVALAGASLYVNFPSTTLLLRATSPELPWQSGSSTQPFYYLSSNCNKVATGGVD